MPDPWISCCGLAPALVAQATLDAVPPNSTNPRDAGTRSAVFVVDCRAVGLRGIFTHVKRTVGEECRTHGGSARRPACRWDVRRLGEALLTLLTLRSTTTGLLSQRPGFTVVGHGTLDVLF